MAPRVGLAFASVLASLIAPRIADACGGSSCSGGGFTPGEGMTVPANLPAIYWQPLDPFDDLVADPAKVTLATTANPTVALPITLTEQADHSFLIVPDQPLVEGTTYVVTDGNTCGASVPGSTAMFHAGPPAPLPTTLGVLAAIDGGVKALEVSTISGSCSAEVTAAQDALDLTLSAEAEPWLHALHFETLVDGEIWHPQYALNVPIELGTSWTGRGSDLVYSVCAVDDPLASQGVDVGTHTVTMRASLPGSSTVIASTTTVDLSCSEPGGCSAGGAGAGWLLFAVVPLAARRRRSGSCNHGGCTE